jgi:hypothetical protein
MQAQDYLGKSEESKVIFNYFIISLIFTRVKVTNTLAYIVTNTGLRFY